MRTKRNNIPASVRKAIEAYESKRIDRSSIAVLPLCIELCGRIPSKKNSRINTSSGRSFPSKEYSAWHKNALKQLPRVKVCAYNVVSVDIFIRFADLRKADLTNKAESIMDLLVDTGILADDNWKLVRPITLDGGLDKNNPGATIKIKEKTCYN